MMTLLLSASLVGLSGVVGTSSAGAALTTSTTSPTRTLDWDYGPPPTTTTRPVTTSRPVTTTDSNYGTTTTPPRTTTTGPCVTLTYISYTPGQTVASYDFEDGALPYSFLGYNGATASVDYAAARSGSYGLKVSGLSSAGGLQFAIPAYSVGAYHVTAWMRSAPGESGRRVILRLRTSVISATSASITPNAWSALDGYFSPDTRMIDACGGSVTVGQSVLATLTLQDEACGGAVVPTTAYLDDLRITYTGHSPTSPPSGGAGCQPPTTTTTSTTTTSPTTTTTTTTSSRSICRIQYTLAGHWPGGWQSAVTLTNISTEPLSNWLLEWTFAGPGTISQLWSATYTQIGPNVVVRPPSWAPTLQPGQSLTFGYLGSGTPVQPTDFRLNGIPCTTA